MKPTLNRIKCLRALSLSLVFVFLTACQSTSSSPPSKTPPIPSPPASGSPSSGVPGVPSPPSIPGSKPGSPSGTKSGSEPGSKSGSEQDAKQPSESDAENGEKSSDSAAIPPEWEEEENDTDTDGDGESASSDDVTFEESSDSDATFEQPSFEPAEGMSAEELDALEKELDESLGDFDEQMQREQTYAEERANENASDDALGGVGVFEDYEGEEGDDSVSEDQASANGEGQSAGAQSGDGESGNADSNREGENPGRPSQAEDEPGNIPDDIPSGNDDDIVARQIREAAENETDPVLREKLWDEYRKYKNQ